MKKIILKSSLSFKTAKKFESRYDLDVVFDISINEAFNKNIRAKLNNDSVKFEFIWRLRKKHNLMIIRYYLKLLFALHNIKGEVVDDPSKIAVEIYNNIINYREDWL